MSLLASVVVEYLYGLSHSDTYLLSKFLSHIPIPPAIPLLSGTLEIICPAGDLLRSRRSLLLYEDLEKILKFLESQALW